MHLTTVSTFKFAPESNSKPHRESQPLEVVYSYKIFHHLLQQPVAEIGKVRWVGKGRTATMPESGIQLPNLIAFCAVCNTVRNDTQQRNGDFTAFSAQWTSNTNRESGAWFSMTASKVDSSRTEFLQVPGQDLEAEWTTLQKNRRWQFCYSPTFIWQW